MDNINNLKKVGIWKALPKDLDKMHNSPRYFKGRKVLVDFNNYGSHNCVIKDIKKNVFLVEDKETGKVI